MPFDLPRHHKIDNLINGFRRNDAHFHARIEKSFDAVQSHRAAADNDSLSAGQPKQCRV